MVWFFRGGDTLRRGIILSGAIEGVLIMEFFMWVIVYLLNGREQRWTPLASRELAEKQAAQLRRYHEVIHIEQIAVAA
jgi:hypothetical protein